MSRRLRQLDIEGALKRTVLDEIIRMCQAANMPRAFIEHIKLEKISDVEYRITNDWAEGGKPLAMWHEYGTDGHWVKPKKPGGVLAFPKPDESKQRHGSAIYFKSHKPDAGETVYSRGHYVSGIPRLEPMTRGFKRGMERFAEAMRNG